MKLGDEVCNELYDTIVIGTGLSEAAAACALTLDDPEKKILVLDPASYYGGLEATVQARDLEEPEEETRPKVFGWEILNRNGDLGSEARRFNFDLRPRLVLCRGQVVDALVRSGVSNYLQFQSLDDALFLDADGIVMRVPCSKAAVFKSKDLGMGEKRQLMRFLQYCMDATTKERAGGQADALKFRNEESLNQGRSLARPQNKKEAALDSVDNDADFASFLQGSCGLSPRLAAAILYAVALLPDKQTVTVSEGMRRVQKYLAGLGRFGVTAFLCPMYGTAELAQAFGRLGSVHGGIFVLRQSIKELVPGEETETDADTKSDTPSSQNIENKKTVVQVHLENGEVVRARNVIAAQYALPTNITNGPSSGDQDILSTSFEIRRICVFNAPILSLIANLDKEQLTKLLDASAVCGHPPEKRAFPPMARSLMVIAPGNHNFANDTCVHAIQLDSTAEAAAPGFFVLHLTTVAQSITEGREILAKVLSELTARAQSCYAAFKCSDSASAQVQLQWEIELARPLSVGNSSTAQSCDAESTAKNLPPGVLVIPPQGHGVDTEDFLVAAETVFREVRSATIERPFLPAEAEREVRNPYAVASGDDDGVADFVKRVRVPQPVDLRWFTYLDGKLSSSGASVSLSMH